MCGDSISWGRGEARRVGRRDWRVRSARSGLALTVTGYGRGWDVLFPSFNVRSSGGCSGRWPVGSMARRCGGGKSA
jgi:hypothetical protein